jgi:hypothetical protein
VFARLLGNISALSEYILNLIDGDYFKQVPTIQYAFEPQIKTSELRNELKNKEDKEWIKLDSKRIRSGTMYLNSSCKIKTKNKTDWLFLKFGFYIYLDTTPNAEENISTKIFAEINGRNIDKSTRFEAHNELFDLDSTSSAAISEIRKSLRKALNTVPLRYRPSLRRILSKAEVAST